MGGIVGFKHGAIREATRFLGFFVVVLLAFYLKDKLMVVLYENLPFFNFFGVIRGMDALNILLYQLISFILISFMKSLFLYFIFLYIFSFRLPFLDFPAAFQR